MESRGDTAPNKTCIRGFVISTVATFLFTSVAIGLGDWGTVRSKLSVWSSDIQQAAFDMVVHEWDGIVKPYHATEEYREILSGVW